jgi:hypothetical protein
MVVQVKVDCLGYFHVPPPDLIAPTDADRQIISQVFSGNLICFGSGKLSSFLKSKKKLQPLPYFACGPAA